MRKKTGIDDGYTDEPIKIGRAVDILPPPAELARMARTERATLTLTKATLDFFREEAEKEHVSYNVLIRNALDEYTRAMRVGHAQM
ncbi:MAG: CopG family transcriptional regulator [Rickettsiales bacterium]